jgi:hypothetical protein
MTRGICGRSHVGSKTGWILALALIVVVVGVAYFVVVDPPTSPPRETTVPGFLDLKMVDVPLRDVIGVEPTAPGNAAADYQKAVQVYIPRADDIEHTGDAFEGDSHYDRLVAAENPWTDPGLKACKQIAAHVADGARKKNMEYTFLYSPKRLTFDYHQPHAKYLFKVAVAVHQCFQVHRDRKEYAEADKHIKDMLIYGVHLLNERALPNIGWQGIEIQTTAIQRLQELYKLWAGAPKHRLDAIEKYGDSLRLISANYRQKRRIVWDNIPANDPITFEPRLSAGDVFNMAEYEGDRSWKAQAIIALGAVKFRMTGRGDLKKARALIKRFLLSDDPVLAAAARAADELTEDQFLHSGTDFDDE